MARTLTVTPATNLGDNVVQVDWTGFHATTKLGSYTVTLYQCRANPASLSDCYTASPFPNSANGNGLLTGVTAKNKSGTAFLEIRAAALLPELDCNQTNACAVIAFENDGNPLPATGLPKTAVVAPISFAKTQADCPPVTTFDVRAEGEASSAQLFYNWAAQLCTGTGALILDYTETSSNGGRDSFLNDQVDVGVTSLPADPAELAAIPNHPAFAYAPVDVSAVVFGYYVVDPSTGQRITDLVLSPRLIARLVTDTGLLDFFNDPEFKRLNPTHTWPAGGVSPPLLRAERNADTRLVTTWLTSDLATRNFLAGNDSVPVTNAYKNYAYPVDAFENASGDDAYLPRSGEYTVAADAFYGVKPADAVPTRPSNQGFIAIIDRPTAERFALPMASVVNASGNAVAPDDNALLAGYRAMNIDSNGVRTANFASTDPAAYPITKIDYAMVPAHPTTDAKTARLKQLLDYAATTGQANLLGGYLALPAELVAQTQQVAASLSTFVVVPTTTTTSNGSTSTTVPDTTPGDTTPVTDFGGLGNCCSSDTGGSGSTDSTPGATPGKVAEGPRKVTPPIAHAPQAPAWLPIASIGPASARLALPLLFGLAVLAVAARIGLSLVGRAQRARKLRGVQP